MEIIGMIIGAYYYGLVVPVANFMNELGKEMAKEAKELAEEIGKEVRN